MILTSREIAPRLKNALNKIPQVSKWKLLPPGNGQRVLYILITSFILVCSCKKNTDNQPPPIPTAADNVLNDNAYIVDTLAIVDVTPDQIIIDKTKTGFRPKVQDVLVGGPTVENAFGFLSKVLTVQENNNQIICRTVPASLIEAFKQLNIHETYSDSFSTGAAFKPGSDINVTFSDSATLINGLGIQGNLKINIPSYEYEFIIKDGDLTPEKILILVNLNTHGSTLKLIHEEIGDIEILEARILKEFNLPPVLITIPIFTPVGIIPVPMRFAQKIILKCLPVEIKGKLKITAVPELVATLGVKYENGSWSNISKYSIEGNANELIKKDFGNLGMSAGITIFNPVYEITPFAISVLKGFFEVPVSFELTTRRAHPNYTLDFNVDVSGGINTKFWDGVENEYSITGSVVSKTILEGDWPMPVVNTTPATAITKNTAACGGDIPQDNGAPVIARGVCFNTVTEPTVMTRSVPGGFGMGVFSTPLTQLSPNTKYYVRAYGITSTDTVYGNEIIFTTAEDTVKVPPMAGSTWTISSNCFAGSFNYTFKSDSTQWHLTGSSISFNHIALTTDIVTCSYAFSGTFTSERTMAGTFVFTSTPPGFCAPYYPNCTTGNFTAQKR